MTSFRLVIVVIPGELVNGFMLEPSVRDNWIMASTEVKKLFTVLIQLAGAI